MITLIIFFLWSLAAVSLMLLVLGISTWQQGRRLRSLEEQYEREIYSQKAQDSRWRVLKNMPDSIHAR